jgi:hypothetical protein
MRTSSIAHCGSGGGGRNDQQGGGREGKRVSAALGEQLSAALGEQLSDAGNCTGGGAPDRIRLLVDHGGRHDDVDAVSPLRSRATRTTPNPGAPSSLSGSLFDL